MGKKKLKNLLKRRIIKRKKFWGQDFFMTKRQTADPILRIKQVLFIQCSYILALLMFVWGIFEIYLSLYFEAVFSFAVMFMLVILLFYHRAGGKLYIVGMFQIILIWMKIFVLLVQTGGIFSQMIIWLLLPVYLATIYLDDRVGVIIWIVILVISLLVLYILEVLGIFQEKQVFVEHYETVYSILFLVVFMAIILLYDNERKLYRQDLIVKNEVLELNKEELNLTIEELKRQNDKIRNLNDRLEDKQKIIENQLLVLKSFSNARAEALKIVRKQKEMLENVLHDLEDSLRYAQLLQNLFLPKVELLRSFLPKSFIIFKQKQYVGGDFYFFKDLTLDKFMIVVGDTTGHGPAGGIMSSLTLIYLNDIVKGGNKDLLRIMEQLRERVIQSFSYLSETTGMYGMELTAAMIDFSKQKLIYVGLHLPLVIIRDHKLLEIQSKTPMIGERFPIVPLSSVTIDIEEGDRFYMFTDGYYSQLNPNFEKFSKLRFKRLLEASSREYIGKQRFILEQEFSSWQKTMEQTDDVTVIAFEI